MSVRIDRPPLLHPVAGEDGSVTLSRREFDELMRWLNKYFDYVETLDDRIYDLENP